MNRKLIGQRQPIGREYAGRVFNSVMRFVTGLPFRDTQCGFKLFHSAAAVRIFPLQQLDGFGFDVEDLYIARVLGIPVVEVPVRWNNVEGTRVSLWNGIRSFGDPLKIRILHLSGKYRHNKSTSSRAFSRVRCGRLPNIEVMCGIAGFVSHKAIASPDTVLQRMTDAIAHRGPDDHRYFRHAPAYLGHRRLSIVDLSAGHQPMPNEDESLWIIYNGEIFNHADVRPELERAGHSTRPMRHRNDPSCLRTVRGRSASSDSAACSRMRYGIAIPENCSAPGIASASSPSTTTGMARHSSSHPKSRRSCSIRGKYRLR